MVGVDIDIVSDPAADFTKLDPARHEVLSEAGAWIAGMRGVTKLPLFLYRHRAHGTFVLCCWWSQGVGRFFTELYAYDRKPETGGSNPLFSVVFVKSLCRTGAEKVEGLAEARERAKRARDVDRNEKMRAKSDYARSLKRRGFEETARLTEMSHPETWADPASAGVKEVAADLMTAYKAGEKARSR